MLMKNKFVIFTIVFIFSLLIRLPNIGIESINPDAVNWHYRCQQFANGLKYFQFERTYPHYHPGVTLCWIMVFPTEVYKKLSNQEVYNNTNYLDFNIYNTLALVLVISLLIGVISYQLGYAKGYIFALLLNFEPFYFGNSKLIHLDTLHSLLILIGLIFVWKHIEKYTSGENSDNIKGYFNLIVSGFIFALAFLTKSVTLVFLPFVVLFLILLPIKNSNKLGNFKNVGFFIIPFVVSVFILFPALWVNPSEYLLRIVKEADRIGVRTGHSQIFFGNFYGENEDPGVLFYIFTLIIKFSPLFIVSIFIIGYEFFRSGKYKTLLKTRSMGLLFFSAYLFYVLALLYSDKKVDRYLLVLVPLVFYFLSFYYLKYIKPLVFLMTLNIISIIYFSPHQFLYFSPILLNFENANAIIGQKSFGMGIFELKKYVVETYGEKSLGFYDIKPIETIYPNSKVFDIRQTSASKIDIVILSKNEILPEKYKDIFTPSDVFYLGEIPLYEIYTKK